MAARAEATTRLARATLQAVHFLSDDFGVGLAERLFTSPRRFPRPAREREMLTTGWKISVDVALRSPLWPPASRRIAAWRWGHGPAVLLVHGWEGRGTQLGRFIEPLVQAGFSVVTFDALAHGDSPGRRLYLADMADCIIDVVRTVGPLHAIIAHSFGAPAVLLAQRRGGVRAHRNVMIAPSVLLRDVITRFGRAIALGDRDSLALEQHLMSHSGLPADALQLDQLVGHRDDALLVVHDKSDREVSFANAEQLAAIWPQATLHATAGLGHRRILRDDDVITRAVAFIQDGVAPATSGLVREVDRLLAKAGV
jgi:pimeloyl-ACP methyl ester carboxylesterase